MSALAVTEDILATLEVDPKDVAQLDAWLCKGGEVTERIKTPKFVVACNLGDSDGCTLFALTYEGEVADIPSLAKNARVETCRVEVAGAGSP